MLEKCASCNSRILTGGEDFLHWRVCSPGCVQALRAGLVSAVAPPELVEKQIQEVFEAPCPLCGVPARTDVYSATKLTAYVIMYQISTQTHICCASCARKKKLMAAAHCLVAGWWSPRAALFNLFVLPGNMIAAALVRQPTEPSAALQVQVKSAMAESFAPQIIAYAQALAQPQNSTTATGAS